MHGSHTKKGQVLSSELIIAVFIFTMVLSSVFFLWDLVSKEILRSELVKDSDFVAKSATEKLIKTPGVPYGWESSDFNEISSVGIVNESRVLDKGKVLRFVEIMDSTHYEPLCHDHEGNPLSNYACSKYLLGLKDYEFYFTLNDLEGNLVELDGVTCSTGKPISGEEYSFKVERSAVLDHGIVKVNLYLWF